MRPRFWIVMRRRFGGHGRHGRRDRHACPQGSAASYPEHELETYEVAVRYQMYHAWR